jgi:hypothetical protein
MWADALVAHSHSARPPTSNRHEEGGGSVVTDSEKDLAAADLGQLAQELVAGTGYVSMADPDGDAAARRLWNARFDELAADPPT